MKIPDVDLEELAAKFGGGGHKKASGFTLPPRVTGIPCTGVRIMRGGPGGVAS